ncbi:Hypothetical predicted protein [Xyrichtys novacula]|uniref:LisH domain-containing protein n=1 Tax=Xyrichtys novacula TaxID=13765 RepID=A0AAV1H7H2_XYRNO|nr:Hypothetical predicted protein [Xyrichtys novacula]
MSDSELEDLLRSVADLLDQRDLSDDLKAVEGLLGDAPKLKAAVPGAPLPTINQGGTLLDFICEHVAHKCNVKGAFEYSLRSLD